MGSTNLRAHHVATPGRAESERSLEANGATSPLLRVTYARRRWGVGGVGRNTSSEAKNHSPKRWGVGWGAGWGLASKTRLGICSGQIYVLVSQLRKASNSMTVPRVVQEGPMTETTSEAHFSRPRRSSATTECARPGAATRRPQASGCAIWNRLPSLARQASRVERW